MSGQPRTAHVPYTLGHDEDGTWCAHAWLGSNGGANGNGATNEEAVADLREAIQMVIDEDGVPEDIRTLDLEVAKPAATRSNRHTRRHGTPGPPDSS